MSKTMELTVNKDPTIASRMDINSSKLEDLKVIRPETDPDAFIPIAPDGGYSYIILFASCFVIFSIDGIVYSYGILLGEVIERYNVSTGEAALIGSIFTGLLFGVAPFSASLINNFGCRIVCMSGSLVGGFLIFLSTFTQQYWQLLSCYGILLGIFIGLVYLTPVIVVNFYFDKRRSIANGILQCGSAVGCILMVPLIDYVVKGYGMSGALTIQSFFILNCVVCGALMRPLKPLIDLQPIDMTNFEPDSLPTDAQISLIRSGMKELIEEKKNFIASSNLSLHMNKLGANDFNAYLTANDNKIDGGSFLILSNCDLTSSRLHVARAKFGSGQKHPDDTVLYELPYEGMDIKDYSRPMNKKDILLAFDPVAVGSKFDLNLDDCHESNPNSLHASQFQIAQSLLDIPIKEPEMNEKMLEGNTVVRFPHPILGILIKMFNFNLFKNRFFLLVLLMNFLLLFGGFLPTMFYATMAKEQNWDPKLTYWLMTLFGSGSIIARLSLSAIAEHPNFNTIYAFIISGMIWILVYIGFAFCNSVYLCYFLVFMCATCAAPYMVLTSILCVEYFGLNSLTNAMGIICFFRGLGSVFCGPIAGWVIEERGYFDLYMIVGLIPIILVTILSFLLALLKRL